MHSTARILARQNVQHPYVGHQTIIFYTCLFVHAFDIFYDAEQLENHFLAIYSARQTTVLSPWRPLLTKPV